MNEIIEEAKAFCDRTTLKDIRQDPIAVFTECSKKIKALITHAEELEKQCETNAAIAGGYETALIDAEAKNGTLQTQLDTLNKRMEGAVRAVVDGVGTMEENDPEWKMLDLNIKSGEVDSLNGKLILILPATEGEKP